jgi:hypothetical protein
MQAPVIKIIGTLPKINPDYFRCIYIYLVRGPEVVAQTQVTEDGSFVLPIARQAALAKSHSLQVMVGPGGIEKHLDHIPNLQRLSIKREHLEKAETEFRVPTESLKFSEEILKLWWTWCRWYCVSGNVVGPDGCPVPGAQVTAYSVGFEWSGFTKTQEVTVDADQYGHFTACFCWCTCPFCFPCWPCWPFWWECWPWWWEFDIQYVLETLEKTRLQANRAFAGLQTGAMLSRPAGSDLIRGQGFAAARKSGVEFQPDAARTASIKSKLANPALREIFPWWWWCCDDPNIVFSVTQGANTIVDENPATETRWCLEDGSSVTLVGNSQTISSCPNTQVPEGFGWTRVGNIPADTAHISGGYAVGGPANGLSADTSDLAFAGTLDIYGGFADTSVAYFQVNAGQWTPGPPPNPADPSRGGTPPGSSSTVAPTLYNYVFIYHLGTLSYSGWVQMGPFNQAGYTNLYTTQLTRQGAGGPPPPPPGLAAFPAYSAGDLILWAYDGLMVSANASSLIGGANVGAVDLSVTAFNAALTPMSLSPSGVLTLTIDNTGLTQAVINAADFAAYTAANAPAPLTNAGDCPAYDLGPGGYVQISVTVSDANGHIWEYRLEADRGHGIVDVVKLRGYGQNAATFPPSPYEAPDIGTPPVADEKSFGGGTEVLTYYPPEDCCYDFRLTAGKRVTNGYDYPVLSTYDFLTSSLKVSS